MRRTAQELEVKNTRDAEMIGMYKRQIAQLAACIADCENRIRRRLPVIQRLSELDEARFQHRLETLEKAKQILNPYAIYDTAAGRYMIKHRGDSYYVVQNIETGINLYGGKDIKLLSDAFFFDFPDAQVFFPNADT